MGDDSVVSWWKMINEKRTLNWIDFIGSLHVYKCYTTIFGSNKPYLFIQKGLCKIDQWKYVGKKLSGEILLLICYPPPVGSYFIFNFLTIEYNYNMIIMKNKGWELIPLCKFCNFWSWHEKETTKRTNIRFRASGIGLDNNQL